MEITLKQWNQHQPRPRSIEQVRLWVRSGFIYPAPRRQRIFRCSPCSENHPKEFKNLQRNIDGENTWPEKENLPIETSPLICTFETTVTTAIETPVRVKNTVWAGKNVLPSMKPFQRTDRFLTHLSAYLNY